MKLARAACIGCIRAYQWLISPLLTPSCRFLPSCSEYAGEAIARHGVAAGAWLAARRLLRCHPWGGAGHDPVPDPRVHAAPYVHADGRAEPQAR